MPGLAPRLASNFRNRGAEEPRAALRSGPARRAGRLLPVVGSSPQRPGIESPATVLVRLGVTHAPRDVPSRSMAGYAALVHRQHRNCLSAPRLLPTCCVKHSSKSDRRNSLGDLARLAARRFGQKPPAGLEGRHWVCRNADWSTGVRRRGSAVKCNYIMQYAEPCSLFHKSVCVKASKY